jgi:hypothetical protein
VNFFEAERETGMMLARWFIVIGLIAVASVLIAGGMKTHNDDKISFSIKHPDDWIAEGYQANVHFTVSSPDGNASVKVRLEDSKSMTPQKFLSALEAGMDNAKNMLTKKERTVPAKLIRAAGAKSAVQGAYFLLNGGEEKTVGIVVYKKDTKLYAVIRTVQRAYQEKYEDILMKIGDSFSVGTTFYWH